MSARTKNNKDAEAAVPISRAAASRNTRRDLISNELLAHAARLFSDKGFAATTLQDIADSMGISRPALYNYVDNKDDLLAALVRDVIEGTAEILQRALDEPGLDGFTRLETALREIIVHNTQDALKFQVLIRSEPQLPEPIAERHRAMRHLVLERLTALIEEALATGRVRPVNARITAFGFLGTMNWVAFWYRPDHEDDPAEVADILVQNMIDGIRRRDGRAIEAGPWPAIDQLRDDLLHLEQTLKAVVPREDT